MDDILVLEKQLDELQNHREFMEATTSDNFSVNVLEQGRATVTDCLLSKHVYMQEHPEKMFQHGNLLLAIDKECNILLDIYNRYIAQQSFSKN